LFRPDSNSSWRNISVAGHASWLIAAAMVPLMLGLTLEVYLLGLLVIGEPKTSLEVATALLGVFLMLWFVFPLAMRLFHPQD
jgi:hypothetical protein